MDSEKWTVVQYMQPFWGLQSSKLLLGLWIVLSFFGWIRPIHAHGGGIPQIANRPIGEYVISVWTDPEPLKTGTVHVTVGLAQNDAVVLNREIEVSVYPTTGGQPIVAQATHENSANRFLYEADMLINRTGDYRFIVKVDGGSEEVSFVDTVEAQSLSQNPFVMAGIGVVVTIVALVGWRRGGRNG